VEPEFFHTTIGSLVGRIDTPLTFSQPDK